MVKNDVIGKLGYHILYKSELDCEDCVFNTVPKLEDSCCLVNCTDTSESAYTGIGAADMKAGMLMPKATNGLEQGSTSILALTEVVSVKACTHSENDMPAICISFGHSKLWFDRDTLVMVFN